MLSCDGPPLTLDDRDAGLLLIDGTWRRAQKMANAVGEIERRSLPNLVQTAYPRCQEEERGFASVEALFLAYRILGWDTEGLLDHYHWREQFLTQIKEIE